jgi:hypothetical protein
MLEGDAQTLRQGKQTKPDTETRGTNVERSLQLQWG